MRLVPLLGLAGILLASPLNSKQLKDPREEYFKTIGHTRLFLEASWEEQGLQRQRLEEILKEAEKKIGKRRRTGSRKEALEILETMHKIINSQEYTYQKEPLFTAGLLKKQIDCDLYSTLYLAMGEVCNISLKAVELPPRQLEDGSWADGHMFVRWHHPSGTINWETTSGKETDSNKIMLDLIARGVYVSKLGQEDNINALIERAVTWEQSMNYDETLDCFRDIAIRTLPGEARDINKRYGEYYAHKSLKEGGFYNLWRAFTAFGESSSFEEAAVYGEQLREFLTPGGKMEGEIVSCTYSYYVQAGKAEKAMRVLKKYNSERGQGPPSLPKKQTVEPATLPLNPQHRQRRNQY